MGLVASAIAAGVGSAIEGKRFDNLIFGSGERGCNGRRSKSFSVVSVPAKFRCRNVDRVDYELDRDTRHPKYTQGIGYYMRDPRHSLANDDHLIKCENCKIPNSCRRDCSDLDRWWRGVKKQFTNLNTDGMARRLITSGCSIKDTGESCSGVPCLIYHKVSKELHDAHGAELEAAWAKIIEDFQKTDLGKALGFVPIIGSTMELAFKDMAGKRPTAGDWISFAMDVISMIAPGLGVIGAGWKIGKVAAQVGKIGFQNARVAFQVGSKSAARIAAKTVVYSLARSPVIKSAIKEASYRQIILLATKGGAHGLAYTVRGGEPYINGLSDAENAQVRSTVNTMLHNKEREAMKSILKEIDEIPFSVYSKFKTKTGEDKDIAAAKGRLEKAKSTGTSKRVCRIKDGKNVCFMEYRSEAFEKLKGTAAGDIRKFSVKNGYERSIVRIGTTRAAAERKLHAINVFVLNCTQEGNSWRCSGRQYRLKQKGRWTSWGAASSVSSRGGGPSKEWYKQVRDAEEEHYGVAADMADHRRLKADAARMGAAAALRAKKARDDWKAKNAERIRKALHPDKFADRKEKERQDSKYGAPKKDPRRNVDRLPEQPDRREKFKITPIRSEPIRQPPPAHKEQFRTMSAPVRTTQPKSSKTDYYSMTRDPAFSSF